MRVILDGALLRKLERVSLIARHVRAGQTVGERRSTKRGASVEFADYRDYVPGDDLRRVDWNIYARLERPFVKLFEEEEDLAVHLLLDGSGSMDWGEGESRSVGVWERGGMGKGETRRQGDEERNANKWLYARQLAASLGYVALTSGDRLTVANLQSPVSNLQFGPVRGRGHTLRLFEWLEGLQAVGTTDLNAGLRAHAVSGARAGLVLLISDLFSPAGYVEGLTALAARGHEVAVIHVLSPDEVEPPLGGDLRLLDVETGDHQEVTIDGGMRGLYSRRLEAWRAEIRATCRTRDVHYLPIETDTPFDRVVLYDLRRSGVVR
ncbi:MAG: DUF58 domain-containing protein [Chloroflexi bacterium]|nr:DUF58 domain-containing protein [Chloroflexota bacterium]